MVVVVVVVVFDAKGFLLPIKGRPTGFFGAGAGSSSYSYSFSAGRAVANATRTQRTLKMLFILNVPNRFSFENTKSVT